MRIGAASGLLILGMVLACEEVTRVEEDSDFDVELGVGSEILEASGDTLAGDTVRFTARVTRDGEPYAAASPRYESADPSVVRLLDPGTGDAVLVGTGRAEVTVHFDGARFPDSLLHANLVVPVDSFGVELAASAPTLQGGLALVGDTLQLNASVVREDGRVVEVSEGPTYRSSDESVVRIPDPSEGRAVLEGSGRATVSVTFDRPVVPRGPLSASFDVEAFDLAIGLSVASRRSGRIAEGDTLVTDSVRFELSVTRDGEPVEIGETSFESSDPEVVSMLDPSEGIAVLSDTGTATITGRLGQPDLPLREASLPLRVTTYALSLDGPGQPVMGDTISFSARVRSTRTGEEVGADLRYESSNEDVLELIDSRDGRVFVRDIGDAQVRVRLDAPTLPHAQLERAVTVNVRDERFYGAIEPTEGDFGSTVELSASEVHRFTGQTRAIFEGDVQGFIERIRDHEIVLRVPAGAGSGPIVLRNLVDGNDTAREEVRSRWSFESAGTVADEFEPNDEFPLRSELKIDRSPWARLLSIDPDKTSPADTNFFYFVLPTNRRVEVRAEWQQEADVDFTICFGNGDPPSDYFRSFFGTPICMRTPGANDPGGRVEETDMVLPAGVHVVAFYCVDCPDVPLTYAATIRGPR